MGFRFYRRFKIAPGVSFNMGKRGASVSVGPKGAKMTFGPRGVRSSVGIPGTGIRYEKVYGRDGGSERGVADGGGNVPTWMIICGLFAIGAFFAFQIYKGTHSAGALFAMFGCGIGAVLTLIIGVIIGGGGDESVATVVKTGTSFHKAGGRWDPYVRELAYASQGLYNFLRELNRSTRCRNQLKALPGMEPFDVGDSNEFTINKRLAAVVYCDIRDCFRRLGHSTSSLYNLEGMGYSMIICLLVSKGFQLASFFDREKARELVRIIGELDHTTTVEVNIADHEDELRFNVIFGKVNSEHEWVQRFSTLLYRWASLVAKADGTVTAKESQVLESIVKMNENSSSSGENVRVTGEKKGDSGGARYEIPKGDRCSPSDNSESSRPASSDDRRKVSLSAALEKLDELIGLEPVKKEVRALTDFIRIQQKRRQSGLKAAPMSYHCVFTGNPGTGKTTVARVLADIYREMGVVKKGHLVETDRSGLIAEYVGQTAVKTNKIIDKALDGVLFIDEAYSLVQGGEKDYGGEAIATLLKRMEDDRDRLVVVLAGYTAEMKDFIDSNPGLQSRFNRYIEFPDYTAEELARIFLLQTEKSQYTCDQDVRNSIVQIMERAVAEKDRNFGNGRYVRNLFEKAIQRQAVRLSGVAPLTTEMLSELTLHDLGFAYED